MRELKSQTGWNSPVIREAVKRLQAATEPLMWEDEPLRASLLAAVNLKNISVMPRGKTRYAPRVAFAGGIVTLGFWEYVDQAAVVADAARLYFDPWRQRNQIANSMSKDSAFNTSFEAAEASLIDFPELKNQLAALEEALVSEGVIKAREFLNEPKDRNTRRTVRGEFISLYDALLAEVQSTKEELRCFKSELFKAREQRDAIKAELGTVKAELGTVKAELGTVKAELGTVKAELGTAIAKTRDELGLIKGLLIDLPAKLHPTHLPRLPERPSIVDAIGGESELIVNNFPPSELTVFGEGTSGGE